MPDSGVSRTSRLTGTRPEGNKLPWVQAQFIDKTHQTSFFQPNAECAQRKGAESEHGKFQAHSHTQIWDTSGYTICPCSEQWHNSDNRLLSTSAPDPTFPMPLVAQKSTSGHKHLRPETPHLLCPLHNRSLTQVTSNLPPSPNNSHDPYCGEVWLRPEPTKAPNLTFPMPFAIEVWLRPEPPYAWNPHFLCPLRHRSLIQARANLPPGPSGPMSVGAEKSDSDQSHFTLRTQHFPGPFITPRSASGQSQLTPKSQYFPCPFVTQTSDQ